MVSVLSEKISYRKMCIRDRVQFYWDLSGITFQPEQLLQEIILGDIGGWAGFVSSVYLTGPGPVSYTHLDVYKRQQQGRAFAGYYYGEGDSPYYPADVDDNALRFFGPERYHSDEFQDDAYLFIPFDADYYQAMAAVIEERFENWQGQDFDGDTLEPSEVAQAIICLLYTSRCV